MVPQPLEYAAPPDEAARIQHNRTYTALLIALTLFCMLGMISIAGVSRGPTMQPESRWAFQMIVQLYRVLVGAMVVTLILRWVSPRAGRIATLALNVILLLLFPFGTALGIYGLLKVDKNIPPECERQSPA